MENITLEEFLDKNYMQITSRMITRDTHGIIEISSVPDTEYILKLKDDEDEYTNEINGLSLEDIEELAKDMMEFVKTMKKQISNS